MKNSVRRLVFSALFAALCCISTLVPQIPAPLGGYINCGDAFVILSGFILGPAWGAAAAGIGSCLADILVGFAVYAPATLLIKAIMAFLSAILSRNKGFLSILLGAVIAEVVMIGGYFIFESVVLGYGFASAANIPFNCVQGVFGSAASVALFSATKKLNLFDSK